MAAPNVTFDNAVHPSKTPVPNPLTESSLEFSKAALI